jgi:hypothetical protein
MAGSGAAIPSRISLVESPSGGKIFVLKDPYRKLHDQYPRHPERSAKRAVEGPILLSHSP